MGITFIHFDAWQTSSRRRKSPPLYEQWPEFFEVPDLDFYDSALRRIVQLFPRQPQTAAGLLKATLLDLLQSDPPLTRGTDATADQRRKITRLVVSVHSETGRLLRVTDMARELHWSPAHFSRIFKLVTQQSPRDFLIEVRLSRARQLLAETSLTIGAIAERLDYEDIYFFSRQFKEKSGISPLQFRQRLLMRSSRRSLDD
jgi:AraC-like DNA-binding protein